MATALRVSLLGGFRLRSGDEDVILPMAAQRLVAFIALQDRPVLRAQIRATLWTDTEEAHASANLRSALWRLRRSGHDVLGSRGDALQLAPRATVDLRDAKALARLATSSSAWWVPEDKDVTLLADDLLPAWYDEWVLAEREQYRQLRLHALESLCVRLTAMGRHAVAVEAGLTAVTADPLRESAQSALIRAFLAEGNVSEARRQLESFAGILDEELGVAPSASLHALVEGWTRR